MKKTSTTFLQIVIGLIGLGVLALLLWEPWLEGVNANATGISDIYFDDPFLAYIYLGSVPFFVALYKAIRLLGYAGQNKIFSVEAVRALRTIKYCALIIAAAIVGADSFIMIMARKTGDDGAGAIMLGIISTFVSIIVAIVAVVFEKILQKAVEMKSENDLTV